MLFPTNCFKHLLLLGSSSGQGMILGCMIPFLLVPRHMECLTLPTTAVNGVNPALVQSKIIYLQSCNWKIQDKCFTPVVPRDLTQSLAFQPDGGQPLLCGVQELMEG
jgi:hypothetical protein